MEASRIPVASRMRVLEGGCSIERTMAPTISASVTKPRFPRRLGSPDEVHEGVGGRDARGVSRGVQGIADDDLAIGGGFLLRSSPHEQSDRMSSRAQGGRECGAEVFGPAREKDGSANAVHLPEEFTAWHRTDEWERAGALSLRDYLLSGFAMRSCGDLRQHGRGTTRVRNDFSINPTRQGRPL